MKEQLLSLEEKLITKEEDLLRVQTETKRTIESIREQALEDKEEFSTSLLASKTAEVDQLLEKQAKLLSIIEDLEATRKDKNNEIAVLKVKEGECEGLKQKLEVLEVRYAALEYQLQADKEEHTTRVCSLEDELKESKERHSILEEELTTAKKEKVELCEERQNLRRKVSEQETVVQTAVDVRERCKVLEQQYFTEKEQLTSQLATLMEEKTRLEKECASLQSQNSRLIGQSNLKQRIHYHAQVKTENNHLKEENAKLQAGLRKKSDHVKHLETQLVEMSRQRKIILSTSDENMKENVLR